MNQKVVIITGASSGIGKACAEEFANQGYSVVLAARDYDKLVELEKKLSQKTAVLSVKTDISIEQDCQNLITATIEKFGKIDVLINNAGITMRALFKDVNLSVIKKVMDVNFWGMVYCTKFAMPHLLQSKGSVVGISSIAGYKGLPARTGYSSSKFAMHGFLESLRVENLKTGLHVFLVCPGFTTSNIRNTALTAEGTQQGESPRDEQKMMSAEEVAQEIYEGVANRKRSITLTLQGKMVVLLNKFFPKLADAIVYNHMAKEADSPFK